MVYAGAFVASSVLFLLLAPAMLRARVSGRRLASVLVLLLAVRAGLILATPIGSDDVYRYQWDGKVQAAGISPYAHAPDAPALRALHGETLPRLVNNPSVKTPYFPLAQWIFRLAWWLSGEAVWGIKGLLLIAEAATIAGTVLLLGHLGRPPAWCLVYAASPLAIVQFALDAHVDALGFPFLVFGVLLHLRGRTIAGAALLGLSMSVKPVAAVVAFVLLVAARDWRQRLTIALVPAAVIVAQFLPYAGDAGALGGVATFARHWMFNGSVFSLVFAVVADNQRARMICGAVLALVLTVVAARSKDPLNASVLAVLWLLLLSPVVHPWYVGWLAVLLPFAPRASALTLVGTVSLTSLTVVTYQSTGVWIDYPWVRVAEYAPVFALLAWEAAKPRDLSA